MTPTSAPSCPPDGNQAYKDQAASAIKDAADRIVALSHDIHGHPEVAFEERYAADRVARELDEAGFAVTRKAYGVETAVEGVYGSGDLRIVLCAEYDALPGLGHACGHNIIAAAAVGAGIALRSLADELGIQVVVLGTPAEEQGGGKVVLLRNGAWEGAAASLIVHALAAPEEVSPQVVTGQCVDRFEVTFTGRAAHAVIAPHQAIHAGSAAIIAQVAVGLARQQLVQGVSVAAITTEGGTVTNIIPDQSRMMIEVRSVDLGDLVDAKNRVLACMQGAAIATGCSWAHHDTQPRYLTVRPDPTMVTAWDANMTRIGRPVTTGDPITRPSTDFGNVSHVVPSIHPHINLKGAIAPTHTVEFGEASGSPAGDEAALDGAIVLAWTIIDLATNAETRTDLLRRLAARGPGATTTEMQP